MLSFDRRQLLQLYEAATTPMHGWEDRAGRSDKYLSH